MDYKFETINCNLCGSDDFHQISQKGKFGLPTNVVLCKDCGLGFLNPRWDRESYLRFYRNEYDKFYRPHILSRSHSSIAPDNPIEQRLEKFNLFPGNVRSILDIGSGEGINLMYFKSLFPESELYAIEPSIESQRHLKTLGVSIIGEDVDSPWETGCQAKFDIIIMRHVLEHFMSPMDIMKKVRSVLSSSGIVYIAVPNNLNPQQNLERSWFRNVHTYYFNKYSLENLMKSTKLEVLQLIEGDEYNQGEVYLVARKSHLANAPNFSNEHYCKQLFVFSRKLKQDRRLTNRLAALLQKVIRILRKKKK